MNISTSCVIAMVRRFSNKSLLNKLDENKRDEEANLGPSCDPSKIKIIEDRSGEGASFDAVRNHIGHPSDLEYIDVLQSSFYCLDGRITKPVLGTLGGDMGEFILALMVYQGILGKTREWDQESVVLLVDLLDKKRFLGSIFQCLYQIHEA